MKWFKQLKWLIFFPFSMLIGCSTPKSEDVAQAAAQYLEQRFGQPFIIYEAKSTFNEGNFNPKGFSIKAAPKNEQRQQIYFNVDYLDGDIIPHGITPDKKLRIARQRLELSLMLVDLLKNSFPKSRGAVLPNSLYPEKVSVEIELYELPTNKSQQQLFKKLSDIMSQLLPQLEFEKVTLEIVFLAPEYFTPRADGLLERYFEFKSKAWKRLRSNLFVVRLSNFPTSQLPDSKTLQQALKADYVSAPVDRARNSAKRWLGKELKKKNISAPNLNPNKLTPVIADSYEQLIFEFGSCSIKKHPKSCPEDKKQIFRVLHNLSNKENSLL